VARTIVDLSMALENDIVSDPPGYGPRIEYLRHADTVKDVVEFFPGLTAEQLPDGEGWAIEWIRLMTHNGTHLDAPWHFASTMDGGKRAITIDEVPLEWCFQPGVKLDYATYLRAPATSRAWMHASGAIVTKLMPFVFLGAAIAAGVPVWVVWALVVIGLVEIAIDIVWSTKKSDWKKFKREMDFATK